MHRKEKPTAPHRPFAAPLLALIAPSLRGYRRAWLLPDASAGLAIAAVGLPSAIAYPAIAGLPAETGIYASIGSVLGYALLGPSRRLMVGPDAATMAVLASVLVTIQQKMPGLTAAQQAAGAPLIALVVGLICFAASLLRLGNLANLLSRPILAGFFIGVAISIIIGQIGRLTGLSLASEGLIAPLHELATRADQIHGPSLLLGLATLALLQLSRGLRLPVPVLVLALAALLSALFDFAAYGIRTVGTLPDDLPDLALPLRSGYPLGQLLLGAAAVFVVSFGAGIITARSFAVQTGEEVDANAELRGFGAANLVSGLLGGFPCTSSDSRTAVNLSVGGQTQLAALVAVAALALAVLFFSGAMRLLPIPVLGAILVSAAISVIDPEGLRQIWRISKVEFGFALIAMAGAISFGVLQGVLVALLATFVYVILNAMQPRVVLLGRIPGRMGFYKLHRPGDSQPVSGLTIAFIQGSLLFFNAEFLRARLAEIIAALPEDTRWLVIDASAITQIDSTGAAMLARLHQDLSRRGLRLGLSELQSDVAALLGRAGLIQAIGPAMIFDDLDDAARAFDQTASPPPSAAPAASEEASRPEITPP